MKGRRVEPATSGHDRGEAAVGFITNWGSRRRKFKGEAEPKNNFNIIDSLIAQMIRSGRFTWLRADTMRRLSNHALATKLYAFMRTNRPNDRGEIEYGLMTLADKLGCSDKKRSRVRAKLIAGERLRRAFKRLAEENPNDYSMIPATITVLRGEQPHIKALMQGLIENVVREDLKPGDRAESLQHLYDWTGWT